jgi:hypothetical protein
MKPSGNHQVQYQPEILFKTDADSLAYSAQSENALRFGAAERWHRSAQQKWGHNNNPLESTPKNALFKRLYVHDDIWKFRH